MSPTPASAIDANTGPKLLPLMAKVEVKAMIKKFKTQQ
jgi:hypothetical protein